jgi:hypothetical protein
MPLQVHGRVGEDCPRCGARIEAIHFKDYVMCYWPEERTGARVLRDRRLSKLLTKRAWLSGQPGSRDHDCSEKSRAQRTVPVTAVSFPCGFRGLAVHLATGAGSE